MRKVKKVPVSGWYEVLFHVLPGSTLVPGTLPPKHLKKRFADGKGVGNRRQFFWDVWHQNIDCRQFSNLFVVVVVVSIYPVSQNTHFFTSSSVILPIIVGFTIPPIFLLSSILRNHEVRQADTGWLQTQRMIPTAKRRGGGGEGGGGVGGGGWQGGGWKGLLLQWKRGSSPLLLLLQLPTNPPINLSHDIDSFSPQIIHHSC